MSEAPPSQLPKKKVLKAQGLKSIEGTSGCPIDLLDLSDLENDDSGKDRKGQKRAKASGGPLYHVKWFRWAGLSHLNV